MAEVFVNKLAAASRQLRCAIRLYFAKEDELAIHTMAVAAYRTICSLKSHQWRQEPGATYLTGLFFTIRSYRRGTLSNIFVDDPKTMNWIRKMAEILPITATSRLEDVRAYVSSDSAKQYWKEQEIITNFLQHADYDEHRIYSMEEVNNLDLLMRVTSSYLELDQRGVGNEGFVFWVYLCVESGMRDISELPDSFNQLFETLAAVIEPLSSDERLEFCLECIDELNTEDADIFD